MTGELPTYIYTLAATFITVWAIGCFYLIFRLKKRNCVHAEPEFADFFVSEPWYRKLNLGACLLSPLWLFANGFWILAIIYLVVGAIFWPLALLFSLLLLFIGTEISWGNGTRWGDDYYTFSNEQHFLSVIAIVYVIASVIVQVDMFYNT